MPLASSLVTDETFASSTRRLTVTTGMPSSTAREIAGSSRCALARIRPSTPRARRVSISIDSRFGSLSEFAIIAM